MRRLASSLLFVLPCIAFAANPITLESCSAQHALMVEVIPAGDHAEYTVRVTDLSSGEVLASPHMVLELGKAESVTEVRDLRVCVLLAAIDDGIAASLSVEQGDEQLDSIESRWRFRPGRLRMIAPGALRVGGEVKAPVVITRVNPMYPEEARQARLSGIVILEVLIDKTGVVRQTNVLKGLPMGLSEAAVDAVRQWTFTPATKNGEPVDVVLNLTINFRLDGKPRPPA